MKRIIILVTVLSVLCISVVQSDANADKDSCTTVNGLTEKLRCLAEENARLEVEIESLASSQAVIGLTERLDKLDKNLLCLTGVDNVKDLQSCIEQSSTVRIKAGEYKLDAPLVIESGGELIGAGRDKTKITSEAGEHVVKFTGAGTFLVRGIGFEHIGSNLANVVHISDGSVNIEDCYFKGGVKGNDENKKTKGHGLFITGNSVGVVRNSLFEKNNRNGLDIRDNAQFRIEQNILQDNGESGVAYWGNAQGVMVSNISKNNTNSGVAVLRNATPTIKLNVLQSNGDHGIYVDPIKGYNVSGSAIFDNTCNDNAKGDFYFPERIRQCNGLLDDLVTKVDSKIEEINNKVNKSNDAIRNLKDEKADEIAVTGLIKGLESEIDKKADEMTVTGLIKGLESEIDKKADEMTVTGLIKGLESEVDKKADEMTATGLIKGLESEVDKKADKEVITESGLVSIHDLLGAKCNEGVRGTSSRWVPFNEKFTEKPTVMMGLRFIDVSNKAHIRLDLDIISVDKKGFEYGFTTWCNTDVYGAGAYWIAVGK